ncbi:MAG: hypothetical protein GY716_22430 [bacterium]|nr:hypothetical protein [bacterium]
MREDLRKRLAISDDRLEAVNSLLLDPEARIVNDMLDVVARYGTPEEINHKARESGRFESLMQRVERVRPEYVADLEWLRSQRDAGAFVSLDDYRRDVLGKKHDSVQFDDDVAVTLEVSACQYFPWLIRAAHRAIEKRTLLPGRFIRVRNMKEQEQDGDLAAFAAAMDLIGASWVETLDTRGTDGSNVHLGGPETITGYFGGVGQPNGHALRWLDEYLHFYTEYGVRQVLNVNPGTVMLGYLLHRLGVDIEFKISVFLGNDNPYAGLWTLLGAKLFSRDDGTTPLVGFNWSNSTDNETLEITAQFRRSLGLEEMVRFEHHITETWKSIVRQPYNRRDELLEVAPRVANISAKHEGGDPDMEQGREHPSDILDYFRERDEVIEAGDWEHLELNFLDKCHAVERTAHALTERGIGVVAAERLHGAPIPAV